jgi:hypothetical protein
MVQGHHGVAYYDMYDHPRERCRPMLWAKPASGGTTPTKAAALKAKGALK